MDLFENLQMLNEMAMPRADAIELCISLGEKFTNHFKEVYELGKNNIDFKHHCQELQSWYDKINEIVLKQNNKKLSKTQKIDWFFTRGSSLENIFNNDNIEKIYEDFIFELMSSNKLIVDILYELL